MNERQRKILAQAFQLVAAGAQKGKRIVRDGGTIPEVRAHVKEMREMLKEMDDTLEKAHGAGRVLDIVAKAKGLS